ncbi:uncharacterized protein BT62DRAFT_1004677 [Guyanagaster necrorhizus]|uniref:Uncharacterized protein n=1 Tax=Guyanagaster necrorhizus TaxID=856835 RepID=A0A9P7VWE1_9AGAR|nr:uncharacterized protein BT62DRAFT_1004677 [Guyanagaster necrorhizus MCA 3950]KAG7447101.1 hypothetical protein BT62DRAFT_1004677 [Guyanagaster necrorhizus MCA 3950]
MKEFAKENVTARPRRLALILFAYSRVCQCRKFGWLRQPGRFLMQLGQRRIVNPALTVVTLTFKSELLAIFPSSRSQYFINYFMSSLPDIHSPSPEHFSFFLTDNIGTDTDTHSNSREKSCQQTASEKTVKVFHPPTSTRCRTDPTPGCATYHSLESRSQKLHFAAAPRISFKQIVDTQLLTDFSTDYGSLDS